MARRDSNDPLNPRSTSSPTTTLENETTGTSGVTGATGTGNLGSSGLSGTTGGVGSSGTAGTYGYGTTGTGSYGTTGTGASQTTNWQRAGQEGQGVKEEAKGLASEAKNQALGMASQAKGHVQNLVGERKDRAAEQISNFAGSLRDAARKLEEGDGGATALGRYATTAAEQVDRVSQYLRDRDLGSFVRDAETFARRHPDVFLGGTFIAGLILARFFKASERRHEGEYNNESWQTVGVAGSTSAQSAYGQTYDRSYGPSGPSYGNTYNSPATGGTRSSYDDERSESAFAPSGPVPPVGG
jgi:uncharacterized protein YjbJ (UPF0337 family)